MGIEDAVSNSMTLETKGSSKQRNEGKGACCKRTRDSRLTDPGRGRSSMRFRGRERTGAGIKVVVIDKGVDSMDPASAGGVCS